MLYEIEIKETCVSIAHQLHLPYPSQCSELHGHNYSIAIIITATQLDKNGMVVDFSAVKNLVKRYDHTFLGKGVRNVAFETLYRPDKCHPHVEPSTAENFAQILLAEIQQLIVTSNTTALVKSVSLWETPNNKVTVSNA